MEILDAAIIGFLNLDNLFVPITKGPKATAYDDHAIHNFGDAANNHHKTQSSSIDDRATPSSAIGTRPRKGFSSPLSISNNRNNGPRSITIMGITHNAKTWYTNLPNSSNSTDDKLGLATNSIVSAARNSSIESSSKTFWCFAHSCLCTIMQNIYN